MVTNNLRIHETPQLGIGQKDGQPGAVWNVNNNYRLTQFPDETLRSKCVIFENS